MRPSRKPPTPRRADGGQAVADAGRRPPTAARDYPDATVQGSDGTGRGVEYNVLYAGKVRYKDEVHPGEQPAIVDAETFQRVQAMLVRNGRTGGAPVRNQFGAS